MKIFLKLFLTFIISFGCLILFDYCFFKFEIMQKADLYKSFEKYNFFIKLPKYFIKIQPFKNTYEDIKHYGFRPVMNADSKLNPIVIFGCSYAYGYIFENEQTISYIMSKYSKRPIYNRAFNGFGVQHAIYQLKDESFYKSIKKPRYIFYIFIYDQYKRLYLDCYPDITSNSYYLNYKKDKNNNLIENKPFLDIYYNLATIRHIYNKIKCNYVNKIFWIKPNQEIFDFLLLHLKNINDLIKSDWNDETSKDNEKTKFVIITFENTKNEHWKPQAEKMGIDVIDVEEILGETNLTDIKKGYFEPEICGHPNGKLFKKLVKKLKEIYPDL